MREDWETVTLASISAKPQYGIVASAEREAVGPKFVRQTDIVSGKIDWDSVPFCRASEDDASKFALREGDLLISRMGAGVGTAARADKDGGAVFAGYLVRFRVEPELADDRFVGYSLHSPHWHQHVHSFRGGAAQPTLNAQQMGMFKMALPPLPEQRAIADVLARFDELIAIDRRLISDLLAFCTASLESITGLVPMNEFAVQLKLKGSKPKGIVDHFSLPAFDEGQDPETIDGSEIKSNKLSLTSPVTLVSRLNPRIPRNWMVYPTERTSVASTEFVALGGKDCETELVYATTQTQKFMTGMTDRASGTTGSHQRVDKNVVCSIPVPDVRELNQEQRYAIVHSVQTANKLRAEIKDLRQTRDDLLPLLLSGAVSPKEATKLV